MNTFQIIKNLIRFEQNKGYAWYSLVFLSFISANVVLAQDYSVSYLSNVSASGGLGSTLDSDLINTGDIMSMSVSHSQSVSSIGGSLGGTAEGSFSGLASLGKLRYSAEGRAEKAGAVGNTSRVGGKVSLTFKDKLTMGAGSFDFFIEMDSHVSGSPNGLGNDADPGAPCGAGNGIRAGFTIAGPGISVLSLEHMLCDSKPETHTQSMTLTRNFNGGEEVDISGLLAIEFFTSANQGIDSSVAIRATNVCFTILPNAATPGATFTSASGAAYVPVPPHPVINISLTGPGIVTISWPPEIPDVFLQQANRISPTAWEEATSGTTNPAVIQITEYPTFFRLAKP